MEKNSGRSNALSREGRWEREGGSEGDWQGLGGARGPRAERGAEKKREREKESGIKRKGCPQTKRGHRGSPDGFTSGERTRSRTREREKPALEREKEREGRDGRTEARRKTLTRKLYQP